MPTLEELNGILDAKPAGLTPQAVAESGEDPVLDTTPADAPPEDGPARGEGAVPGSSARAVPVHARQTWERLVEELGQPPSTRVFRDAVRAGNDRAAAWHRLLKQEARAPLPPALASAALTTAQAAHDAAVQHLAAYEQTCREAEEAVQADQQALADLERSRITGNTVTYEQVEAARKTLDHDKDRVHVQLPLLRAGFETAVQEAAAALAQALVTARLERHNALVAERLAFSQGALAQTGQAYAQAIEKARALIDAQQAVDATLDIALGEPVQQLTFAVQTVIGDVLPLPPGSRWSHLPRVEDLAAADATLRPLTPQDLAALQGTGTVWVQYVGRLIPTLRDAYRATGSDPNGVSRENEKAFQERKPIEVLGTIFAALQAQYKDGVRKIIPEVWR